MQANKSGMPWKPPRTLWGMVLGSSLAMLLTFPIGAIISALFRFPVPFAGYGSGLDNVMPALFAVFFYGIYGGFVVVAILGAVGAYIVHQQRWVAARAYWRRLLLFSAGAAGAPLLLLSVLDFIIGPW